MQTTYVVTEDRKPEIERVIRRLPSMLAGSVPDEHGIAAGFRARLGWAFFSLVFVAFNAKGRGERDSAGEIWHPLSPGYLAYQRPITGRKPPRAGGHAPGGKDGFLTPAQLKLWRRTYADRLAWFIMREPDKQAMAHAAAVAWIVVKQAGGKTKLNEFGRKRVAGADYQILVDTGHLRRSLQPGRIIREQEVHSDYRPQKDQAFDGQGARLVVGTNVHYARYHHHGRGNRRRRLWPERLPDDWWRQIRDTAISGMYRIGEIWGGRAT